MNDPVRHPSHYTSHPSGIECLEVTRHMSFDLGNATKYLWRGWTNQKHSGPIDLEKAAFYIRDFIAMPTPPRMPLWRAAWTALDKWQMAEPCKPLASAVVHLWMADTAGTPREAASRARYALGIVEREIGERMGLIKSSPAKH
ncbi:DUF3310 domain-containing protein [Nguyenibacter vanlangensis]|uniref:DUF3310 domain-containing protein n=1 Tax=Nguyenibacter vanlangensis TaxID=1216886 RepID=A0ABZ3D247_9PROT